MFRQYPVGKVQIKVCRTLSCALAGSHALCARLRAQYAPGEPDGHGLTMSADGHYSVEFVECLAGCGTGPVMMVGDDFHEAVTPEKADAILKEKA